MCIRITSGYSCLTSEFELSGMVWEVDQCYPAPVPMYPISSASHAASKPFLARFGFDLISSFLIVIDYHFLQEFSGSTFQPQKDKSLSD
ncbi:hypothetical protein [Siphonobacter sp. SORGH_AS_1065]|uniref:hypothetical protein n=1 Tax=Siphonobacter sp. SORGH_AS_1065 TaxID=3041795 RepID=UPI002783BC43|nr:hypothetical protein [Siphonobacter sp. SORGH_AS_1065]MDQ1089850.1 hypothetical protein [Siphonobacter sp. SORGH_AS_1065]